MVCVSVSNGRPWVLSYALELCSSTGDWTALLGELQVAFVLFLLIGSMVRNRIK